MSRPKCESVKHVRPGRSATVRKEREASTCYPRNRPDIGACQVMVMGICSEGGCDDPVRSPLLPIGVTAYKVKPKLLSRVEKSDAFVVRKYESDQTFSERKGGDLVASH